MGLAAFWTHTDRGTRDMDRITSASELLRCGEIAGILTRDAWGKSRKGLCHAPTAQAYTTALWPVVCVADGCNSTSGGALLLFYLSLGGHKNTLFHSTAKPTSTVYTHTHTQTKVMHLFKVAQQ